MMDDLSSHKRAGVREAIEGAGATLRYLPAYSPGYNPIDQASSKLKALLRQAGERAVARAHRFRPVQSGSRQRSADRA